MNDLKEYYFRTIERFKVERKDGKITVTDTVKKETVTFDDDNVGKWAAIRYVKENSTSEVTVTKEQILEHLKNIPNPDEYVKEFIRQIEKSK